MWATRLTLGDSVDIGGQMQQQAEAFSGLVGAMALAVIFIHIVLASPFGSLLQPIATMASLPLALTGVMLALLFWRSTLNLFSMIGRVMLVGLVTKNAMLLVMVFGMLPMALALTDGGAIQAPMGRAIIGGVLTSTLLTPAGRRCRRWWWPTGMEAWCRACLTALCAETHAAVPGVSRRAVRLGLRQTGADQQE